MGSRPPPNAYHPGTVLTVGSHKAVVIKYLSEGGFATVYKVEISPEWNNTSTACLKRVLVPDKASLNTLRAEVDSMKRLAGYRHIVSYIDSHAARMETGQGYEVFVLMELCENKGLIDFMNTRLQNRLTEAEVLRIMGEVTEGVANMHALNPALIHRDIKIENVLISGNGDYKLCDFGSASPVLRPPRNSDEFAILQNDVLKNTTPQYRSPEMVDLYRGLPIDEKSDIWALGIFLYKLCYYTTPFEAKGELAILHAKFEYPDRPVYSDRMKNLIAVLLREDPRRRPNAYQTLEEVCRMRGVPVPISDYTKEKKRQQATATPLSTSTPASSSVPPAQPSRLSKIPTMPQNGTQLNQMRPPVSGMPVSTTAYPQFQSKPPMLAPLSHGHHSTSDLMQSYSNKPVSAISSNYVPEPKDPFQERILQAKTQSPPPKPPRPLVGKTLSSLNKSMGNLTLDTKEKPPVPTKPKYVDSVVQTDDEVTKAQLRPLSSRPKPRPQSAYFTSAQANRINSDGFSTSNGSDHNQLKRIITGLSAKSSTVELSPGENHINSSVDFLKNLQQQDSGKSWVQQHTGGSISSLRRISTGSKKLAGQLTGKSLMSQFTGKFSRSHSRSSSRASSIHENHGVYSSSNNNLRASSDSIDEETTLQTIEEPKMKRSLSIRARAAALLSGNGDPPVVKTAHGYGNDKSRSVTPTPLEVDSEGFKKPAMLKRKPPVPKRKPVTPPLTAQTTPSTITKTPSHKPGSDKSESPSTLKKAPPKPKKPTHLKAHVKSPKAPNHLDAPSLTRTLSRSSAISNISIPDIDEIEKNFNERFPSAV